MLLSFCDLRNTLPFLEMLKKSITCRALSPSFGSRTSAVYKQKKLYNSLLLLPVSFFEYEVPMCTYRIAQALAYLCFIGWRLLLWQKLKKWHCVRIRILWPALKCTCEFKNSFFTQLNTLVFHNILLLSIESFISTLRLAPGVNAKSEWAVKETEVYVA